VRLNATPQRRAMETSTLPDLDPPASQLGHAGVLDIFAGIALMVQILATLDSQHRRLSKIEGIERSRSNYLAHKAEHPSPRGPGRPPGATNKKRPPLNGGKDNGVDHPPVAHLCNDPVAEVAAAPPPPAPRVAPLPNAAWGMT